MSGDADDVLEGLGELWETLDFDEPTDAQYQQLWDIYERDFIQHPFTVRGKRVKVVRRKNYQCREFKGEEETFVHLITRESKYKKQRMWDCWRANRLHWIKPVLEHHTDARIRYYEWADAKGAIKQHYWYWERDYMVVVKPISRDVLMVTAFVVDYLEYAKYEKRWRAYQRA